MPARAPEISAPSQKALRALGQQLRARRKHLGLSAVATAEAAGISRVTLHRIERGEPSVAMGAWLSVMHALGLDLELRDPRRARVALPASIRPSDYPQLGKLAWQLRKDQELTPEQALELYERNWRHVDPGKLDPRERELLDLLLETTGRERLLV